MDDTFARFGLPGEPGSEEFWAAATARAMVPAMVPGGEGGWTALFLWRGSPASLDFESWSEPVPLRRWGGTDCWYAEVSMPARLRVTYQLRTADAAYADPLNPVGAGGDRSIAATPDAPAQPHWPAVGPRRRPAPAAHPPCAGPANGSAGGAPCACIRRAAAGPWCCCSTGTTGCTCTRP
ncbi:hypothetical protein GCM10020220_005560 [Nonomuraea rubra]|uniref:hypothetical protein n=1 Tax=Nonomuraea rubra TaxID=46180 RepID=UPI0031ED8473